MKRQQMTMNQREVVIQVEEYSWATNEISVANNPYKGIGFAYTDVQLLITEHPLLRSKRSCIRF